SVASKKLFRPLGAIDGRYSDSIQHDRLCPLATDFGSRDLDGIRLDRCPLFSIHARCFCLLSLRRAALRLREHTDARGFRLGGCRAIPARASATKNTHSEFLTDSSRLVIDTFASTVDS